ncbi:ABC transporter substrate-binding protein [Pseudonocardia sp. TRM90224]|uniref:ABC transporter substrate-binding protein n=1 Tax=Pseudonocardia sp. TRM90224 TaxID=2812678 RepID=UPI001E314FB8|nr:extracellular solute-binding protein [Pseudonocardia sp. TRM90224]
MASPRTSVRGIRAVALALAFGLLAACGSGAASPDEPLQFFLSGDANQGGGFAAMAAQYQQETGVRIQIVDLANADLPTKLKNAAQANDLPALARVGGVDPVWRDATMDLRGILDGSGIRSELAAIDDTGKVLSLPTDVTAVGLFINKSLFDRAGVAYPTGPTDAWTWDEFVSKVKEVQARTGTTYGMVMDRSSHRLKAFLYEFGSDYFQADDSGAFRTNANTRTAFEYFKGLNDDSFMPRSVWLSQADPNAMFKSGDVVAYYSGSWQIADFAKNITDFQWASVRLPQQTTRATNYGNAASAVVFQGTGQEDAAYAFLQWLYRPENYRKLAETSGFLPAVDGLEITHATHADAFALYDEEIAQSAPIVKEIKRRDLAYEVAGVATEGDPVRDETVRYLNGELSVDELLTGINGQLTEQLGRLP